MSNCISQERTNLNLLLLLVRGCDHSPLRKREEGSLSLQRSSIGNVRERSGLCFSGEKSLLSLESQESKVEKPFMSTSSD